MNKKRCKVGGFYCFGDDGWPEGHEVRGGESEEKSAETEEDLRAHDRVAQPQTLRQLLCEEGSRGGWQ